MTARLRPHSQPEASGRGEYEITDINNSYIEEGTLRHTHAGGLVDRRRHLRIAVARQQHGARKGAAQRGRAGHGAQRMKLLVTGGAGFIGSNFVHHTLARHPDWKLVVLDKLTYAGNLKNLEPRLQQGRCEFVQMDICDRARASMRCADAMPSSTLPPRATWTAASKTLRPSSAPTWTARTTCIQACREAGVPRFVHVSTDEVYGSLGEEGEFTEESPLQPNSPYAATKAASDLLVLAYVRTHKFRGRGDALLQQLWAVPVSRRSSFR